MHHVPLKTVATATRPEHVTQARDPSTSLLRFSLSNQINNSNFIGSKWCPPPIIQYITELLRSLIINFIANCHKNNTLRDILHLKLTGR